jgi:hypothetical protein
LPGTIHERAAPKSPIFIQCKSAAAYMSPIASDENGKENVALETGIFVH